MCAHGWQGNGGGLAIYGTATLTDSNVYENQAAGAGGVRLHVELSLKLHPQRPDGG